MTLVFNNLSGLISGSFGLNEIASGITIGKAVGSIFSRSQDSFILKPVAERYGLFIKEPPSWLHGVCFGRDAVILGKDFRTIHAKDVMADISLRSIEGIATFVVLILRDVEPIGEIVGYLERMLRGHYWVVGSPGSDKDTRREFDFSIRNLLWSFVSSIIDSDRASPQHAENRAWMYRLTQLVGGNKFTKSSTIYSRKRHERFLRRLLGAENQGDATSAEPIDTFSAGVAMIALAARSNGANVRVDCMLPSNHREAVPPGETSLGRNVLVVRLWLTHPPTNIASQMDVPTIGTMPPDATLTETGTRMLAVLGGDREISLAVASQLGCDCTPEEILAMWVKGIEKGAKAKWQATAQSGIEPVLKVSDTFWETQTVAQIATLADSFYAGPTDKRRMVPRTAANIFHQVFDYSDYRFIDESRFRSSMNLIFVSLTLGCLKALAKSSGRRSSVYAWTFDCAGDDATTLTQFCRTATQDGVTPSKLLWMAARIWGGSDDAHHGYTKLHERVLGIACPQLTIVSTVLSNPTELASFGLDYGLLSLQEGSIPMLPRDPRTGYIIAGSSPASREPRKKLTSNFVRSPPGVQPPNIIHSLEPYPQQGSLSIILCVWHQGDVALELDLAIILINLTYHQKVFDGLGKRDPTKRAEQFQHISCQDLFTLGDFEVPLYHGILWTGSHTDWIITAMGCIRPGDVTIMKNEDDVIKLYEDQWRLSSRTVVVLCSERPMPSLATRYLPPAQISPSSNGQITVAGPSRGTGNLNPTGRCAY